MTNNKRRTATVAVINEFNKVLILRRGETAPWMPGRYCLPGGHAEPNEDIQYCAVRELSEETGISYPIDELNPITINYKNGYSKIVWIARISSPKIVLNWEHSDSQWIRTRESLLYPLVPGLMTTIKTLHANGLVI